MANHPKLSTIRNKYEWQVTVKEEVDSESHSTKEKQQKIQQTRSALNEPA